MRGPEPGERLTIVVDETARHGRTPLYAELVHRARDSGLAGATVVHGSEGYGESDRVHTAARHRITEHGLPAVVTIVDRPERLDAFLRSVGGLIDDGFALRRAVGIVRPGGL
jgi:uncharacterized protein